MSASPQISTLSTNGGLFQPPATTKTNGATATIPQNKTRAQMCTDRSRGSTHVERASSRKREARTTGKKIFSFFMQEIQLELVLTSMSELSRDSLKAEHWVTSPEAAFRDDLSAPNFKGFTGDRSLSRTLGSNPEVPYRIESVAPRHQAMEVFVADPHKAWQRCIRETYARLENRPQLPNSVLKDAWVVRISNEEASALIFKYEWLATMAAGTKACYGLRLDKGKGELLGVVCFATGSGSPESLKVCSVPAKTVILARGACVPHAPRHAASKLIRHACREAHKEFGWECFIGYSDEQAGELGIVYAAVGWRYMGKAKQGIKTTFYSPDGTQKITSYNFNKRSESKFYALGWDGKQGKYSFLRSLGWIEHREAIKSRWLWFEGERRAELEASCRFPFLSYPKR